MNGSLRRLALLIAGVCLAAPTGMRAAAQDALGGGDALDNNLNTRSGGRNAPQRLPDFRGRNLLVTGNVVGGRGFRGSVGYTADNDFRGAIGSDDLFDIRALSAPSSIEFINFGRTYTNFRFGQELGLLEFRRAGYGSSAGRLDEKAYMINAAIEIEKRLETASENATTAARLGQEDRPDLVGIFTVPDENNTMLFASGSSLGGLKLATEGTWLEVSHLGTYDIVRVHADNRSKQDISHLFREFEPQFETARKSDARVEPVTQPGAIDGRPVDSRITGEYKGILRDIADRYGKPEDDAQPADPSEKLKELQGRYDALRKLMSGQEPGAGETPEPTDPIAPRVPGVGDDPTRGGDEETGPAPRLPDPNRQRVVEQLKLESFGIALRHDQKITRLAGDPVDRFNEVLDDAERMLRNGRFFQSERRFLHALRFSPNHPLATVGLGHAKLGAGLYLSGSMTLRGMLRRFPELIDAQFEGSLLPSEARLDLAIHTLRLRAGEEADRASNGFLMAYIGHQRDDEAVIREGLDLMEAGARDDPLLPALRAIWLPNDEVE